MADPSLQPEAWDDALERQLPPHYANLEKLLRNTFFTVVGPCAGDVAMFGVFNIVMDVAPELISLFPKLEAFYGTMVRIPSLELNLAAR